MSNANPSTNLSPRWRSILALTAITLLALGLGACNTVRGLGEDFAAAGQTVADTAAKHGG